MGSGRGGRGGWLGTSSNHTFAISVAAEAGEESSCLWSIGAKAANTEKCYQSVCVKSNKIKAYNEPKSPVRSCLQIS